MSARPRSGHDRVMNEPSSNGTKRLYRPRDGRVVAGVCAGLAAYFGVDPTLVRLAFALVTVFGGPRRPDLPVRVGGDPRRGRRRQLHRRDLRQQATLLGAYGLRLAPLGLDQPAAQVRPAHGEHGGRGHATSDQASAHGRRRAGPYRLAPPCAARPEMPSPWTAYRPDWATPTRASAGSGRRGCGQPATTAECRRQHGMATATPAIAPQHGWPAAAHERPESRPAEHAESARRAGQVSRAGPRSVRASTARAATVAGRHDPRSATRASVIRSQHGICSISPTCMGTSRREVSP